MDFPLVSQTGIFWEWKSKVVGFKVAMVEWNYSLKEKKKQVWAEILSHKSQQYDGRFL